MMGQIRSAFPFVEVLYGSAARGDNDAVSDIDLLIVDDSAQRPASRHGATVVRYTWAEFREMSSYGSLFLRHLRKEGHILGADDLGGFQYRRLLAQLPCYCRAAFDLRSFELAIHDSEIALTEGDTSIEFEIASLATVMRHCSILGSYLLGAEDFTRTGAFDLCCDKFGLGELPKEVFRRMYSYRIAIARDLPFPDSANIADGLRSVAMARTLLNGVKEYASHTAMS
jgi:Nucleotidyltransferase domain